MKAIPYSEFRVKHGPDWETVTTDNYFKDKRVVVFALPGAFTPICSSKMLPRYEELYDKICETGINNVYCLSVNDHCVMQAWFDQLNIEKVEFIPDGDGTFTRDMNMLVNKPEQGFGMRSWRYAMVVDNGRIEQMFIEPGINQVGADMDPYGESEPEKVIKWLVDQVF